MEYVIKAKALLTFKHDPTISYKVLVLQGSGNIYCTLVSSKRIAGWWTVGNPSILKELPKTDTIFYGWSVDIDSDLQVSIGQNFHLSEVCKKRGKIKVKKYGG